MCTDMIHSFGFRPAPLRERRFDRVAGFFAAGFFESRFESGFELGDFFGGRFESGVELGFFFEVGFFFDRFALGRFVGFGAFTFGALFGASGASSCDATFTAVSSMSRSLVHDSTAPDSRLTIDAMLFCHARSLAFCPRSTAR